MIMIEGMHSLRKMSKFKLRVITGLKTSTKHSIFEHYDLNA